MAGQTYQFPLPTSLIGDNAPVGFVKSASGLIYPKEVALNDLKKSKELRRLSSGSFFSDWGFMSGYGSSSSGAYEKPADEVGFSFLRDSYAHSGVDELIINRRIQQVRMLSRICTNPGIAPGWRIVHDRYDDPNFKVTEEIEKRCREVEEVIRTPRGDIHSTGFDSVLVSMTREELVIDRKCFVLERDRAGRIRRYWMVDGASILPIMSVVYEYVQQSGLSDNGVVVDKQSSHPVMDYQTMLERASEDKKFNPNGYDLTRMAYVQEIDSKIVGAWSADQIAVDVRQASVWINKLPYGQGSLLQQSLDLTAAWVNAWQYNQELFRTNIPETIVALFGDYDPNGMEAFKRSVFSEAGPGSWHRTVFLPADQDYKLQVDRLRGTPTELQFPELLKLTVLLKSHVYGYNFKHWGFPETSRRGATFEGARGRQRETELDEYKDIGIRVLLQGFADLLTTIIVKSWYPDLKFIWDGLVRQDERERIEILNEKVKGFMTIDEARKIENLEPLPNGYGALPLPLAEQNIKTEAELLQAETEAEAIAQGGTPTPGGKTGSESKGSSSTGRPAKSSAEPGAARRQRDRTRRHVHEATGGASRPRDTVRQKLGQKVKRDTAGAPSPGRAKDLDTRKRSGKA